VNVSRELLVLDTKRNYFPEIQGLRGLAVMLVTFGHFWPLVFSGGIVGVDVFFVISGYLITGMLVQEKLATGTLDLPKFYIRRVRRLLPAASLVLFFVGINYRLLPVVSWPELSSELIASTFYFQNWLLAIQSSDYMMPSTSVSPLQHFWSLAIEEQFYIFWPAILALCGLFLRCFKVLCMFSIAVLAVSSLYYSEYLTRYHMEWAYFSTFTRVWELLAGASLAFIPFSRFISSKLRLILGLVGIVILIFLGFFLHQGVALPGTIAIIPVLGAMLVIVSGDVSKTLSSSSILSMPIFQYFGGISYSLYLWHWPLLIFYSHIFHGEIGLGDGLILLAVAIALAHMTKVFVEDKFRYSKASPHFPVSLKIITVAMAASVVIISLWIKQEVDFLSSSEGYGNYEIKVGTNGSYDTDRDAPIWFKARFDLPKAYGEKCIAMDFSTKPLLCHYGNPFSKKTLLVVGDSHAVQWLPALELIAKKENLHLIAITKSSCSYSLTNSQSTQNRQDESCVEWNHRLPNIIEKMQPDVILFSQSTGYVSSVNGLDAVELADRIAENWTRLTQSGISIVAIRDTPHVGIDIPVCLSKFGLIGEDCTKARDRAMFNNLNDPLVLASRLVKEANIIDMTNYICGKELCRASKDGVIIWRDSNHMTATFTRTLAVDLHKKMAEFIPD